MTTQRLFPDDDAGDRDLRAQCEAWLAHHPGVYQSFVALARDAVRQNTRTAVKYLNERIRWTVGAKLTNSFTPYIARRLCRDVPGFRRLIELRPTRY